MIAAKSQCNKIQIGFCNTNAAGAAPYAVEFVTRLPVELYISVIVVDGVSVVKFTPEPAKRKQQNIPGMTYIDLTNVILFDLTGIGLFMENTRVKSVGYAMTPYTKNSTIEMFNKL